ncbi:MAG: hypothetical protein Kow0075_14900 [Salibacteraceae bacterium]
MSFNHWDIVLSIPLIYAAWKGLRKGLIIELASIAALVAGVYVAANFSEFTAGMIRKYFSAEGSWVGYIAFLITFIGVVFGVYALARLVERAVNLAALKPVNKILGLLFGLLKMGLIVSIALNLLVWVDRYLPVLSKSSPEESTLFVPVKKLAPTVLPVLTQSRWLQKAEDMTKPMWDDTQH